MKHITYTLAAIIALAMLIGCQSTPKRKAFITIYATMELEQNAVRAYGAMLNNATGEKLEKLAAAWPKLEASHDVFQAAALQAAKATELGFSGVTPESLSLLAEAIIQLVEELQ